MAAPDKHLVIARRPISHRGDSRVQRGVKPASVEATITRLREGGYDVFWEYGPANDTGDRALLRHWSER